MTLESNRMLGAVGSLLIVATSATSFLSLAQFFFPSLYTAGFAGPVGLLGLAGLVLFMIAMNGLANYYKDRSIFSNALYWILTSIIGGVVAFALSFAVLLSILSRVIGTIAPFTQANPPTLSAVLDALQPYVGHFIPVGVVVFAITVVSVVFIVRAFNRLADASGVRLFRTAGLLFLVGIALTGALGLLAVLLVLAGSTAISTFLPLTVVSNLVSLAAWTLTTVAFFRIRALTSQMPPMQPTPQTSPVTGQVKYCPHCGAQNSLEAVFCVRCGEKLQP